METITLLYNFAKTIISCKIKCKIKSRYITTSRYNSNIPHDGKQGWVGTEKSRDETRQDRYKVLNFFRDKTRRDIISRQIHSRQPKTAKGMSRQDKTYKFFVI